MPKETERDFLITGRCVNLRTTVPEDAADYDSWGDPDRAAWKFDGPWFKSDVNLGNWCRKRLEQGQAPPYSLLEIETSAGVHIGWVNSYFKADDPHMTEVGIDIVEDSLWDKGLGAEAMALWVDYQFRARNLTRIGFSTWSGNPRMIRVGEKLGFVREGCIRNACEVNGRFYDRIKMGILRPEWEDKKSQISGATDASRI